MTASAVTSSAEASTSASVHSTKKPVNSANNTNSSWTQPFFHDFEPTLLPSSSTGTYSSVGNSSELTQSSSSPSSLSASSLSTALLSFPPLFSSWSHQPHSSVHFLRGNGLPFGSSSNAIGNAYSTNGTRTSSEQVAVTPTGGSPLSSASSSSPSSGSRNVVPAAAIELSSASAAAASQTISLHPSGKTTTPVATTTPTILTTSKRPVIIIYPTVSPESIVIPIVSCIFGFPILALMVICCLRRRAKLARERDRRRNYDMQDHAVSLVRFSPIHRLNNRSSRAISLRPERSLSRGFPSLELDTVIEERSDPEQTQTDLLSPESPLDPQRFHEFNSS